MTRYVVSYGVIRKTLVLIVSAIMANLLWRAAFSYPEDGIYNQALFWLVYICIALAYGLISANLSWSKNEERFITDLRYKYPR